jgi:hypothetical protein
MTVSRKKAPAEVDAAVSKPGFLVRFVANWYFGLAAGLLMLSVIFASSAFTPVHATLSDRWPWTLGWGFACLVLALLMGFVSAALQLMYGKGAEPVGIAIGILLFIGTNLFSVHILVESINVYFDSSAATQVSTQILRIEHSRPGERQSTTLHLAPWGAGDQAKVIKVRQNPRIFRVDGEQKYATFHVRAGFLGLPYAAEFP